MKIAYLGIKGSNSYIAAMKYFGEKDSYISCSNIEEVCDRVENGESMYGVVPIENSTTGSITEVYDSLLKKGNKLKLSGEIIVRIHHHLVGKNLGIGITKFIDCYSHQQAFAQCKRFMKRYSNLIQQYAADTATAAKYVSESKKKSWCAIANKEAAILYGLKVFEELIEDNEINFTRFAVLGQKTNMNGLKASVAYGLPHMPGSLYASLAPFTERNINLTKIESRPIFEKRWEYVFFIDVEFQNLAGLRDALKKLRGRATFVNVLGIYEKGREYES